MKIKFIKVLATFLFAFTLTSCTKDVPPELTSNKQKSPDKQQMPDDSIHRRIAPNDDVHSKSGNSESKSGESKESTGGEGAAKYMKDADEADSKYQKSKSESDKKICIEKQMAAANYLMFEADLPPKEKYKPALQRYRKVLEMDPKNEEAIANKTQIEEIYKSMGKPIPE